MGNLTPQSYAVDAELKDAVAVVGRLKDQLDKFETQMREVKLWRMKMLGEKGTGLREKLALAIAPKARPDYLQDDGATFEQILMRHCGSVADSFSGASDGGEIAAQQRARIATHIKGSEVWKNYEDKARAQGMQVDIRVEYLCIADFGISGQDFGTQISMVTKAGDDIRPHVQARDLSGEAANIYQRAAQLGMRPPGSTS